MNFIKCFFFVLIASLTFFLSMGEEMPTFNKIPLKSGAVQFCEVLNLDTGE